MGPSFFEAAIHSAPDAIFITDATSGAILYANSCAEELTGYSRQELLGMYQHQLHPVEMRERYDHIFAQHARGVRQVFDNVQILRKGGGVTNVEISGALQEHDGRRAVLSILRDTSSRDILLKKLELNERRNRSIAELAPIGIAVHCEGRIVFANHTALKLFGEKDPDLLLGRKIIDFVHPDDRPAVRDRIDTIMKHRGSVQPIEERLLRADGTTFMAEVLATAVDWDGRPSIMVAFQDVTETVRGRRYRESLLQLLQNVMRRFETPVILDELAVIFTERFNAAAICLTLREQGILRVRAATGVAAGMKARLDGSPVEQDSSPCARAILLEAPFITEDLTRMPFRREFLSLFTEAGLRSCWTFPIQNQENRTIGAISAYFRESVLPSEDEMSLLQHAATLASVFIEKGELLDENYRLSLVARQTREGVVITDMERSVQWVNESFTRLTGYTLEEVRGRNLRPILQGPATSSAATGFMKERLASHHGFECRIFNYRKSGEGFWNDLHVDPMHDRSGTLIGFIGLLTDVSKEMEKHERLEQALTQTEETSRARSEFLSIASHEIRTPLNSLLGLAHLLLSRDPRPDQKDDLILMRDSAARLHSLVSNLLEYGRIEAGRLPLEKAPFSLAELATEISHTFEGSFAAKGLYLRVQVDPAIPEPLVGDSGRIRQVIQNLVSNALKFTSSGGAELAIHKRDQTDSAVEIEIIVRDTGEGIPRSIRNRIFEPFFQGDTSLTRRHSGTGLGLTIAEKILEMHGSKLDVESEIGLGSTFQFRLRLERAGEKPSPPVVHDLARLTGFRILIVEDYEASTLVTRKFLELWNIQVDQARNGEEAVYKTRHGQYDLILMDLHMPVMDGYEASRRIREFNSQIPIIALTASDQKDIPDRVREAGMNDLIVKPFHPSELNRRLAQFLKK